MWASSLRHSVGMNMLDEGDHFRINSQLKTKLKNEFGSLPDREKEAKMHKLNRNLLQVLKEDIIVSC